MRAISCTSRPIIFRLVLWNSASAVPIAQDLDCIADRRQRIAQLMGEQSDKFIFLPVGFFELFNAIF